MTAEHYRMHLERLTAKGDWTGVEHVTRRHGWSLAGQGLAGALAWLWRRLLLIAMRRQPLA